MQLEFPVGDFTVKIHGQNKEEVAAELELVDEMIDGLLETTATYRQLAIAKGVFAPAPAQAKAAAVPAQPQSGPPADDAPTCNHGAMLDFQGKGYKKRWYCPKKGKDKACWAKD